jgi:hypothetical protein
MTYPKIIAITCHNGTIAKYLPYALGQKGGCKMKSRTLISGCILCVVVLIIFGSCATMGSPDRMVYERFCGTWANEAYEPEPGFIAPLFAKWIVNPDGTFLGYDYLIQTGPARVGFYTVEKRWTDSDGNSWYHLKSYWPIEATTQYELWKVDKYNAVLEINWSNNDYPTAIDTKDMHSDYSIFYRY